MRSVLVRVDDALDRMECEYKAHTAHHSAQHFEHSAHFAHFQHFGGAVHSTRASGVEGKVASLVSLVESQRHDILLLRTALAHTQLEASKNDAACRSGVAPFDSLLTSRQPAAAELGSSHQGAVRGQDEARGSEVHDLDRYGAYPAYCTPSVYHPCVHGAVEGGAVTNANKVVGGGGCGVMECAHGVIEYSSLQAHLFIDVCEEMLVRSMTSALEMLDEALSFLCDSHVVCHMAPKSIAPEAYRHVINTAARSRATLMRASSLPRPSDGWWVGDNLYNAYC